MLNIHTITGGRFMSHPFNLAEAEATFGIERIYKRHRRVTQSKRPALDMKYQSCWDCGKQGYFTEEAARVVISRMLRNGTLSGPDSFSFKPYLCPHGFWHTGHDPASKKIFRDLELKIKQALEPENASA